ncbi:hypothetical protein AB0F77_31365 [Streptomyces sp. NPDC026672]|uniref:hypothetical protein n=1 Tax=unclassified Streptomyces TaxID=2593676 RepID=UPI0033C6408A
MNVASSGVCPVAERAIATTAAPPSMSRWAMAAPMPREAPVTIARRPWNSSVTAGTDTCMIPPQ